VVLSSFLIFLTSANTCNYIVSAGANDTSAILWDLDGNIINRFYGHNSWVSSVALSSDCKTFISTGEDNTVRWYHIPSLKLLRIIKLKSRILSMAMSNNNVKNIYTVVLGSVNSEVQVWDLIEGKLLKTLKNDKGHKDSVNSVKFNLDDTKIISGGQDRQVIIWDVSTGTIEQQKSHTGFVNNAVISGDNKIIVADSTTDA